MTNAITKKTIKLSFEFDDYVAKHPKILDKIPKGAELIITSADDKKLTEANLTIADSSRRRKFVAAHKTGNRWRIQAIKK